MARTTILSPPLGDATDVGQIPFVDRLTGGGGGGGGDEKTSIVSQQLPLTPDGTEPTDTGFKTISEKAADATLRLIEEHGDKVGPLTPEAERRLKRKLKFYILSLVGAINIILFIDKSTLGYSSLLGIMDDTGIDDAQFDNLYTIFYTGYIIAQLPGHWLMQRLPLGKFVTAAVFVWSIIIFLHCTASNYGGLIALRFFLGIAEAVIVPSFEMTLNMFFPPEELLQLQPLFWISCLGSPIPASFISYGILYSKSSVPAWKLFMIITGGLTLLIAAYSFWNYPDNPARARFLSVEERIQTIRRVQNATRSSIEQKQFKRHQFIEAVRDPVSWLFFLAAFMLMISNNLQYQQNLIYLKIGVSNLGSTLVNAAGGGFAVAVAIVAWLGIKYVPGRLAFWGLLWCLPAVAGGIGMVTIPWDDKIALLACILLASGTFGNTYILTLGWASASAAGYTKKLVRNVFFMAGYGIANIISPQIWVSSESPRYYGAWIAQILVSWIGCPLCLLTVYWILSRRNKERRKWREEQESRGILAIGAVEQTDDQGQVQKVAVDISMLDLTDLENKYFIYPL